MKQSSMTFNKILTVRLAASVLLGAVMFIFAVLKAPFGIESQTDIFAASALFSLLYIALLTVFSLDEKTDNITLLFFAAILAALIYLRISMLGYRSGDYNSFLNQWVEQMKEMSVKQALCEKIGDYNMPYLYFLLGVSRTSVYPLILIKWFSCIFDFVTAFFVMKCVALKSQSKTVLYLSFIITAALPTVFINSAYWAQCDSILAALCIMSVYFALCGKGIPSVICYALAFSVKLQAIFIIPIIIVCFIIKKIKLWHAILFPTAFFATLLPAMFAGRKFVDCISIYIEQAGQYPKLTLNAPSVWQIFKNFSFDYFQNVGIMLAGIAALILIYICFKYKNNIDNSLLIEAFYISALIIPFLLPRMHERYFYIADILSVMIFFYDRKKWYVPLVTVFASTNAYLAFLAGGVTVDQSTVALALLIILIISLKNFIERVRITDEACGKAIKG